MMNSKANEISAGQVFIFMIGAQIGFGILSLASTLADKVGHDGWLSLLIGGLIAFFIVYLVVLTLKKFKNLSILDISNMLFGKIIGGFFNLLIIGYLCFATILTFRLFSEIINLSALKHTPGVVLTCFIILPNIYLNLYGLKYICRYITIELAIIVIVIIYYLLLVKYFRLSFLQPVGAAGLMPILKNSFNCFVSFLGFELLPVIYPYIKDKKNTLKYALYGNLYTMIFYLITVIFLTGFFGENMLKQLVYPPFSLARAYRAPVLERLDLFFITLWFPIMSSSVQVYYFAAFQSMKSFFKMESNNKKCKILLLVFTVIAIGLSRLPKDIVQVYKLLDWLGYIGISYTAFIIICYLFSFLKLGGKKSETAV